MFTESPVLQSGPLPQNPPDREVAPPLFLVGCGRSGTTLLRMILNTHPELAIPQESQFIYKLARRLATGRDPGRLQTEQQWEVLVRLLEKDSFVARWDFSRETLRHRLNCLPERSYAAAFRAVFSEFMKQQGKTRWGDKTPQHVQYLLLLDRLFPTAKFIHIIRDGRDVALSLKGRAWGPRTTALAGYYWKWLVLSGMVGGALLGPERYREVRYENLVLHPEATVRALCQWAGLQYTPAMLDYHGTRAAHQYAQGANGPKADCRVTRPPDPSRTQRWTQQMTARDQRSILRQTGALLAYLGYHPAEALPAHQSRELQTIRTLMRPHAIAALDAVLPRSGPLQRFGLLADRAKQGLTLYGGDLHTWARRSVRWQRTVGRMMV